MPWEDMLSRSLSPTGRLCASVSRTWAPAAVSREVETILPGREKSEEGEGVGEGRERAGKGREEVGGEGRKERQRERERRGQRIREVVRDHWDREIEDKERGEKERASQQCSGVGR